MHVAMHQNPSNLKVDSYGTSRIWCRVCHFIVANQRVNVNKCGTGLFYVCHYTIHMKTNHTTKPMHHVNTPLKNNSHAFV